jgi:predicted CDP-diglyceride synthetase/phosphatidate cytidylyltransferase
MLILAAIVFFLLKFIYPQKDWSIVRRRFFYWWGINCLFAIGLLYTHWIGLAFMASSFYLITVML